MDSKSKYMGGVVLQSESAYSFI